MKTIPRVKAVTEVEVVVLTGSKSDRVSDFMETAAKSDAPRVKLLGRDAGLIANLWNALPPGHQDRCHIPPFGLRFFSAGTLLLEASLCWECNNIFGIADGARFSFEFDASAAASVELLARAQEAARDAKGSNWL